MPRYAGRHKTGTDSRTGNKAAGRRCRRSSFNLIQHVTIVIVLIISGGGLEGNSIIGQRTIVYFFLSSHILCIKVGVVILLICRRRAFKKATEEDDGELEADKQKNTASVPRRLNFTSFTLNPSYPGLNLNAISIGGPKFLTNKFGNRLLIVFRKSFNVN